jgi:hypothetical protein
MALRYSIEFFKWDYSERYQKLGLNGSLHSIWYVDHAEKTPELV